MSLISTTPQTSLGRLSSKSPYDYRSQCKVIIDYLTRGGAERIALAMAKQLREASTPTGRILQNKRVSKISPTRDRTEFSKGEGALFGRRRRPKTQMHVHVEGEEDPRVYDHVLSTISLGALRLIDLEDCNLSWRLRESLRSLQYGASVKVGIRFTYRWWEAPGHGHIGGVTATDRFVPKSAATVLYKSLVDGERQTLTYDCVSFIRHWL